jgi:hypothetical protein
MVHSLSKDERNLTDGSGDMPVQSSGIVSTALVDCSNPADSCAKTKTRRDVGDSRTTQNFDADSVVIAQKNSRFVQNLQSVHTTVMHSTVPAPLISRLQAGTYLQIR